jgi:hypothetical protein
MAGVTGGAGAGALGGRIGADVPDPLCFGGTAIAEAGVSGAGCSTGGVTGASEIADGFATCGGWTVATGAVGG